MPMFELTKNSKAMQVAEAIFVIPETPAPKIAVLGTDLSKERIKIQPITFKASNPKLGAFLLRQPPNKISLTGYKPLIIGSNTESKRGCTLLWIKQPKKQGFIAILALEKDYICQP